MTYFCLIVGDYVKKKGPGGDRYGIGEVKRFTPHPMPLYRVEWESSRESGVTVGWYRQADLRKVTGEASDELLPVEKGEGK